MGRAHTVPHTRSQVRIPPMPLFSCISVWLKKGQLQCWPLRGSTGDRPEANLRNILHTGKKASEGYTLALNPMADITRSPKQGYHRPHIRTDVLQNFYKVNKKNLALHPFQIKLKLMYSVKHWTMLNKGRKSPWCTSTPQSESSCGRYSLWPELAPPPSGFLVINTPQKPGWLDHIVLTCERKKKFKNLDFGKTFIRFNKFGWTILQYGLFVHVNLPIPPPPHHKQARPTLFLNHKKLCFSLD